MNAIQLLLNMKTKYEEYLDVVTAINEIGKVVNLCGNNISRAEETAAELKTNVVLQQQDYFLEKTLREIPSEMIARARIQPVFAHPRLIGEKSNLDPSVAIRVASRRGKVHLREHCPIRQNATAGERNRRVQNGCAYSGSANHVFSPAGAQVLFADP